MNDQSEKETVEAIRNWWQENGKFIIAGIVLGVGGLVGWNQWQAHEAEQAESASAVFEKLIDAVERGSEYDAKAAAATLA
ncbi:MAG: tetratricopeptide repeat protein, partial [Gammaproteobacteria bacterium]|nr:tetratricopeptide repeat protein [Gammaproteobacteria bacterium]